MKKYSKIRRLGHDRNQNILSNPDDKLLIKEKVDGSNFRFTVIKHEGEFKFLFGSKNVEYKINGEPDYEENVDKRFKDAIDWIRENVDAEKLAKEETYSKNKENPRYTFFAENMVPHSLEYDWENTPQVLGFDIYSHESERYLSWSTAKNIFKEHGIPTVSVIYTKYVKNFDPDQYEIPSSNYRDGKAEGIVIINQDQEEDNRKGFSTRAKLVSEKFLEKHKQHTGAHQNKEAIHGHEKIVSKYCTNGRIRKHIEKMRDEGRTLGMEMMQNQKNSKGLPIRVATDIIEEEADDIVSRNDTMKWKDYRSMIAKRCVYILRQEIHSNAK